MNSISEKFICKYGRITIGDLIQDKYLVNIDKDLIKFSINNGKGIYIINIMKFLNPANNSPLDPTNIKAGMLFDYIKEAKIVIIKDKSLPLPAIVLEVILDTNIVNARLKNGFEKNILNISLYLGEALKNNIDILSKNIYKADNGYFSSTSYRILDLSFGTDHKLYSNIYKRISNAISNINSQNLSINYPSLRALEPIHFDSGEEHHSAILNTNMLFFSGLITNIVKDKEPVIYCYTLDDNVVYTSISNTIKPLLRIPKLLMIYTSTEWPASILFAELMTLFSEYILYSIKQGANRANELFPPSDFSNDNLKMLVNEIAKTLPDLSSNLIKLELFYNESKEDIKNIIIDNISFKGPQLIYQDNNSKTSNLIYLGKYINMNVTQLIFTILTEKIYDSVGTSKSTIKNLDIRRDIASAQLNLQNSQSTQKLTSNLFKATIVLLVINILLLIITICHL